MRIESPSQAKRPRTKPLQKVPREGTKLRELYDVLEANKGIAVKLGGSIQGGRRMADLTDYYGLDVRCAGRGTWILAGEWFGTEYVDYIARRLGC